MSDRKAWNSYFDADQLAQGNEVFANKLRIKDAETLERWERRFTSDRLQELEKQPVQGELNYDHLKQIHGRLFQDVYSWAGEARTVGITKAGTDFTRPSDIESDFNALHKDLAKNSFLQGRGKGEFVGAFTDVFNEANRIHPFREGNGRATRVWAEQLAQQAGYTLDQKRIDDNKETWNHANAKAAAGDKRELAAFFNEALRPTRSLAFENTQKQEALAAHPELKGAYEELDRLRGSIEKSYPNNPKAQAMFDEQAKREIYRRLDTGGVTFGAAREAEVPRDYARIAAAADKRFSEHLACLVKDKRFENHTPKELASAAYWRGAYQQSSEGLGKPFEAESFDSTISKRQNAAALLEPPDLPRLEREVTKQLGKDKDDGLSL